MQHAWLAILLANTSFSVPLVVVNGAFHGPIKPKFGEDGYWDNFYQNINSSAYDWFQQWRDPSITRHNGTNIVDVVLPYLLRPCEMRVLHIGCGTSSMVHQMLSDGFADQVCVDVSREAVRAMAAQDGSLGHPPVPACGGTVQASIQFLEMDARRMPFGSEFDSVMDKGVLDAQMSGSNGHTIVADTLDEIERVLQPGALYVQISHSAVRAAQIERRPTGELRSWVAESQGPLAVKAPIWYARQKANLKPGPRTKDTSYIYVYRKTKAGKAEL